ncbi:L-type lectin-domain containing receptor kinase IX.1-like [Malus sylvestris]|uniref:L-type lectin-domain containing receptor kinase IX.1-like n=1 Tax=Malus sylvestris TaxID=3752 RepID=UPI0021AC19E9|nr:L-type lectin-domain containing receptor kinase IX.1-like [Malus sylvestris]
MFQSILASFILIVISFLAPLAHPLSFKITQFDQTTKNISYEGDASRVSRAIQLNEKSSWMVGRATYTEPLHLWDSSTGSLADFTTHFTFIVDTGNKSDFSDGFAFFLGPVGHPIPVNSAGSLLGLFNSTDESNKQIVAVEFDTFANEAFDPQKWHVGININSINSVDTASWKNVSSNSGKLGHAWITYNATSKNLSVFWTYDENPVFVNNSSLSHQIDLREVLLEKVTIGFSASTGVFPERHLIYSWEFSSSLNFTSKQNERKRDKRFLIVAVAVSFFVLMFCVAICWLVIKKKRVYRTDAPSVNTNLEGLAFPKRFAYKELAAATNGFANDVRLGQGGSGQVYKGMLKDLGCAVAVKRIFAESEYDEKIFVNEVKILSRLIHRNLVQFIGWCHEQGECLLVYAYMPNGSLDTHLFGHRAVLQWDFRFKIALGLASALHYLHEDVEQCVLHRDIKSANVLLDDEFSTKLGDFGIAKLMDPRFRTQTTGVVGTFGYMAPEYEKGGRASKESDMFSFGVVALELACGRRTFHDGELDVPLVSWVWQLYLAGNLLYAADERLDSNFDINEMECLLIVGLWCTNPDNKERPKAGQVMNVLQLEAPLPDLPHDMHDLPLPQLQ